MTREIAFLKSYLDKQLQIVTRLEKEVIDLDIKKYENQYVFSLKVQQLYTAIEDIFKQVAKVFENNIDDPSRYHGWPLTSNQCSLLIPQPGNSVIIKYIE